MCGRVRRRVNGRACVCEGMRGRRSVCGWDEWRGSVCVRVSGGGQCVGG